MIETVPILNTDRLRLRPLRFSDYQDYAAVMQSERAVHMGGPLDDRESWGMFCHCIGSWGMFGHGALVVELADARHHSIGMVSINSGPLFIEDELGWFLFDGFEGNGYATEAAMELRQWAFGVRKLKTLVSYFSPENVKSIAVATRLGGVLDEHARVLDPTDIVYRYSR
ncbi:GNAT family N-acetyltransferase [Martelella sp. FOR1707]